MLYEVITYFILLSAALSFLGYALRAYRWRYTLDRITSYNVCYTKLLRELAMLPLAFARRKAINVNTVI